ncbi:MAG: hypothetical protein OXF66_04710 [Gammaproteobacteria bacterium]|nr:hypothetical protein [Gammaproteobacteria bacterium]MCY4255078.1 hypothetical protein [Gammaproteobacteria bacterium]MCY4341163.1 hypothetical protein [Gammaproteobacteria bacterium]
MQEWLDSPLIIVAFIAAISALGTIFIWVGRVNADRETFKEFITEVRGKLDSIFRLIAGGTVGAGSPTQLTDLGREVSREISAKEWAKKHADVLAGEAEGKKPFDIQDFSFNYVFNRHKPTADDLSLWKESAYQHGLDVSQVKNVLMVELRDALLEKFGLTASD